MFSLVCLLPPALSKILLSSFLLNQVFLFETNKNVPRPSTLLHYCFFLHKLLKKSWIRSPLNRLLFNHSSSNSNVVATTISLPLPSLCQLSLKLPKTFISKSNGHFQIKSPQPARPLGSIQHSWPLSWNTLSLGYHTLHFSDFPPPF